jgi:hypothetical protein
MHLNFGLGAPLIGHQPQIGPIRLPELALIHNHKWAIKYLQQPQS